MLIVAVGMTMLLIAAEVDLSVGASMAFTGCVAMDVMNRTGSFTLGVLAALAFAGAVGLVNGLVVTRLKINSLIATIATMMILQGGVFLYTREAVQNRHQLDAFTATGAGYLGPIPIPVIIAAAIFVAGYVAIRFMSFGRHLYAVGANEKAARLSGLRPANIKLAAFVFTGLFVGVTGLILGSLMNAGQPTAGRGFELTVIAAVVLGGTSLAGGRGTLFGTLLGVLLLKIIDNGIIVLRWNQDLQMVVPGVVIILASYLDIVRRKRRCAIATSPPRPLRGRQRTRWKCAASASSSLASSALDGVDLTLAPGKVHALMGENGAGKSTLIKILAGVYGRDAGTILIGGREASFATPRDAMQQRHQGGVPGDRADLRIHRRRECLPRRLSGDFMAARSTGRPSAPKRLPCSNASASTSIPPRAPATCRSASNRWSRLPARSPMKRASSSWTSRPRRSRRSEVALLFTVIRRLTALGIAVLYVTHKLDEVFEIADTVTVLRDGRHISTKPIGAAYAMTA